MRALHIQGWMLTPAAELPELLAGWRRDAVAAVVGDWCVVQPVDPGWPIGSAHRVVVVAAGNAVQLVPGSQGEPAAPPAGFTPVEVRVRDTDALVVDARCWMRSPVPVGVTVWDAP